MIPNSFKKYLRSKEFKDLLKRYQQAVDFNMSAYFEAQELVDIAEYFRINGHDDDVDAVIAYALDMYPDNESINIYNVRNLIFKGEIEKAESAMAHLDECNVGDKVIIDVEICLVKGDETGADKALTDFFEGLRSGEIPVPKDEFLDYDDVEDYINIFTLNVVPYICDYNFMTLADKWFSKIDPAAKGLDEDLMKDDPSYLESKARILGSKMQFDEAIETWNEYIAKDAFSELAWQLLAQCYFLKGDRDNALDALNYCRAIAPDLSETYLMEAKVHFSAWQNDKALAACRKYIEKEPQDIQGEVCMGTIYFAMEQYDEALEHLLKAEKLFESSPASDIMEEVGLDLYRLLVNVYSARKDKDKALEYADKMVLLGYGETELLLLKAGVMLDAGDTRQASVFFSEALERGRNDSGLYIQIGCILVDAHLFEQGYLMLSETIRILEESDTPVRAGYDRLAYSALMLDKYDEFLSALEKSIANNPVESSLEFASLFPSSLTVNEYVEYARNNRVKPS